MRDCRLKSATLRQVAHRRNAARTMALREETENLWFHGPLCWTRPSYKAYWFVLCQTEGAGCQPPAIPEWNEQKALEALNIQRVEFEELDGNAQGYAKRGRKIAVSP